MGSSASAKAKPSWTQDKPRYSASDWFAPANSPVPLPDPKPEPKPCQFKPCECACKFDLSAVMARLDDLVVLAHENFNAIQELKARDVKFPGLHRPYGHDPAPHP